MPTFGECGLDPYPGLLMPDRLQLWQMIGPWLGEMTDAQDSLQRLEGEPAASVEAKHFAFKVLYTSN